MGQCSRHAKVGPAMPPGLSEQCVHRPKPRPRAALPFGHHGDPSGAPESAQTC